MTHPADLNLKLLIQCERLSLHIQQTEYYQYDSKSLHDLIKDLSPDVYQVIGPRSIIPAIRLMVWSHGFDLESKRITLGGKQVSGYVFTHISRFDFSFV